MIGHHVIGRRAASLRPGINEVDDELAVALLEAEIVISIEQTHHRKKKKALPKRHSKK